MAIYYEPEDICSEATSRDLGLKVTRQQNGGKDNDRHLCTAAIRHKVKKPDLSKQGWPQTEVNSPAQPGEDFKREESPSRVPDAALEGLFARHGPYNDDDHEHRNALSVKGSSLDLAPADVQPCTKQGMSKLSCEIEGAEIERPRSALHTGDFFEEDSSHFSSQPPSSNSARSTSPPRAFLSSYPITPWHAPVIQSFSPRSTEPAVQSWSKPIYSRLRAPSLGSSLHSSFIFRPPTSPLVHAASNTDLDFCANTNATHQSSSPEKGNRRRTLPPDSFLSFQMTSSGNDSAREFSGRLPQSRRGSSFPYQAHQPRRSLTSGLTDHSALGHPTPALPRSRKPSFSSDHSSMQHASMVGSFEESILRGRMSTAPSKPLDFVAQIGVLGRGDCKPNLRCPAHVTVPFPAVFYNYPSVGSRSFSDDSPSPYVGTIDLAHSLKPVESKRIRRRPESPAPSVDAFMRDVTAPENTHIGLAIDRKMRERRQKRSASPRGPLGGCYRIPQQGQLQIVIKNPNKTAVKLYLVPYSLDGMEAGTKTFIRQRSFSAGPILEKPLTDRPQAAPPDLLPHKPILRYLIHLKFCCPSKGRYYLYDSIRVVFANRVPDGKESLRNEVQLPEPRYSLYRPGREPPIGSTGARLATERASRKQMSGLSHTSASYEAMDGLAFTGPVTTLPLSAVAPAPSGGIPFHVVPRPNASAKKGPPKVSEGRPHNDAGAGTDEFVQAFQLTNNATTMEPDVPALREWTASPTPGFVASTSVRASPVPWPAYDLATDGLSSRYSLSRAVSPNLGECGEGLLAKELKNIDSQDFMDTCP